MVQFETFKPKQFIGSDKAMRSLFTPEISGVLAKKKITKISSSLAYARTFVLFKIL